MSITVSGKPFDSWMPDIQKALDGALADHLISTQKQLAEDNPKDTGRMASSWFISPSTPSNAQAPERDGPGSVVIPEYNAKISWEGTWYITNNLPYAERVCYDPIWAKGGAGGPDWFTRIANQQPTNLGKTVKRYLQRIR